MTKKAVYWGSLAMGALAILLAFVNTALVNSNRKMQESFAQRQALIEEAARLSPLNQELAQALAEVVIKKDDDDIRGLLASQGIALRKPGDEKTKSESKKNK